MQIHSFGGEFGRGSCPSSAGSPGSAGPIPCVTPSPGVTLPRPHAGTFVGHPLPTGTLWPSPPSLPLCFRALHAVCQRQQNPPAAPSDSAFLGFCQLFACQLCCYVNVLRRVSLSRQSCTEGFPNGDQWGRKKTQSSARQQPVLQEAAVTNCSAITPPSPRAGKAAPPPKIRG